jgi:Phage related hypothetical protein (DUF1799)
VDQIGQQEPAFLWPECLLSWRCWMSVQSQWRVGMGGPTGLDYAGVRAYLELAGLRKRERSEVFADLVLMERVTLEVWADRRNQS